VLVKDAVLTDTRRGSLTKTCVQFSSSVWIRSSISKEKLHTDEPLHLQSQSSTHHGHFPERLLKAEDEIAGFD